MGLDRLLPLLGRFLLGLTLAQAPVRPNINPEADLPERLSPIFQDPKAPRPWEAFDPTRLDLTQDELAFLKPYLLEDPPLNNAEALVLLALYHDQLIARLKPTPENLERAQELLNGRHLLTQDQTESLKRFVQQYGQLAGAQTRVRSILKTKPPGAIPDSGALEATSQFVSAGAGPGPQNLILTTTNGGQISLEELRRLGRPVLLKIGTTSCIYCNNARMHAMLHNLQRDFGSRVYIASVNDPDGSVAQYFGVQSYPSFVLMGADGQVAWSQAGPSEEAIAQQIQLALSPGPTPGAYQPGTYSPYSPLPVPDPSQTTVRVVIPGGGAGSGIRIASHVPDGRGGFVDIYLTADHVLLGQSGFRVDIPGGSFSQSGGYVLARDPASDVGLLAMPSTQVLPVSPVVGPGYQTVMGQSVRNLGFAYGRTYVDQTTSLTQPGGSALRWSHRIGTMDAPDPGQSGGGLFDSSQVMGVCSTWDCTGYRTPGGIFYRTTGGFAGPRAIHNLLDQAGLSWIYTGTPAPGGGAALAMSRTPNYDGAGFQYTGDYSPCPGGTCPGSGRPGGVPIRRGPCPGGRCPGSGQSEIFTSEDGTPEEGSPEASPGAQSGNPSPQANANSAKKKSTNKKKKPPACPGLGFAEDGGGTDEPWDAGGPELWLAAVLAARGLKKGLRYKFLRRSAKDSASLGKRSRLALISRSRISRASAARPSLRSISASSRATSSRLAP